MNVRFLRRSEADLERIANWIATDNPARAVTFIKELRTACEQLAERSLLYPIASESSDLQRRLYKPYLIFYRVRRGEVVIVSIRHGARDNSGLR